MLAASLFEPLYHGALGWWDEIINLTPVVIGVFLLWYLYRASRQRYRRTDEVDKPEHSENPQPPPQGG